MRLDWFSPVEDEVARVSSTVRLDANSAAVRSSRASRTHIRSFSWRSLEATDGGEEVSGLVLSLLDISSDFGTVAKHGEGWRNGNCWLIGSLLNIAVRIGGVENAATDAVNAEIIISRGNIVIVSSLMNTCLLFAKGLFRASPTPVMNKEECDGAGR